MDNFAHTYNHFPYNMVNRSKHNQSKRAYSKGDYINTINARQGGVQQHFDGARYGQGAQGECVPGQYGYSAGYEPYEQPVDLSYDSFQLDAKMMQLRAKRKRRKVLKIVLAVVLALLAGIGVAFALYVNSINDAMKLDSEYDSMKSSLAHADLSKPFYALLVGSDWRENSGITDVAEMSGDQQRADVIMLARVDCPNKKVTILTIPRDTPYRKSDGTYCKINELYNEGRGTLLVPAVEQLTGIKISHYAEIYFSDFEQLIDALGGVEIDVPVAMDGTDALTGEAIHIDEGRQLLNGKQAMMFSRERKSFEGNQDEQRQFNIRAVVNAIAKKITKIALPELPSALYGVASCVRTDLQFADILQLANSFHGGMTMYTGGGPADGDNNEAAGGLWLCYENPAGWERVMRVVEMGEDPGKVAYGGDVCTIAGTDIEVESKGEPATDGLGDSGKKDSENSEEQ